MKSKLLLSGSLLAIGLSIGTMVSCTTGTLNQSQQISYLEACEVYNQALITAHNAYASKTITQATVAKVYNIAKVTSPLCEGAMPSNSTAIVNKIVNATAQINSLIK
ncbi:MAG: hypothetical protein QXI16_00275 [Sulfolobaceae archaeon]